MGFNRFSLLLALRLAFVFLALLVVGYLVLTPGYHAATLLAMLVTIALAYDVFKFVSKTNQELARFLDAARYADFGQRFRFDALGAGFEGLGDTFTHILDRFREDRADQPADRAVLGVDRGLESALLLGDLGEGLLKLAEGAELLFDVPELGEALLDLVGAANEVNVAAFELGLDGDERLQHRLDDPRRHRALLGGRRSRGAGPRERVGRSHRPDVPPPASTARRATVIPAC